MASNLISSGDFLTFATKKYIAEYYQSPTIKLSAEVSPKLGYIPSIQFKIHSHLTVLVEVSELVYPAILGLRRTEIEDLQMPIAVYCACPEEAYTSNQADAKRLVNHGFGLLTISLDGTVQRRTNGIPLIQRIAQEQFQNEIRSLPSVIRRRLVETYDKYVVSAPSGVADISEVVEGLILTAGREAAKKRWIDAKDAKPGATAKTLDALQAADQFSGALAAIGSARGYISEVRNLNHHFPKSPLHAARKYRECRHSFLEGIKRVVSFHGSMKNVGLTGGLK